MFEGQNGEGSSTDLLEPVPLAHLELPYEVEQLKLKVSYIKTIINIL